MEAVNKTGAVIEVARTERSGHAAEIAAARAEQFDVVLTLGGDGTAMEVAGALAWRDTPIGVLPGGTGNLLARALGVPMRETFLTGISAMNSFTIPLTEVRIMPIPEPSSVQLLLAGLAAVAAARLKRSGRSRGAA